MGGELDGSAGVVEPSVEELAIARELVGSAWARGVAVLTDWMARPLEKVYAAVFHRSHLPILQVSTQRSPHGGRLSDESIDCGSRLA